MRDLINAIKSCWYMHKAAKYMRIALHHTKKEDINKGMLYRELSDAYAKLSDSVFTNEDWQRFLNKA